MGDALKEVMRRDSWETTREQEERIARERLHRARLVGVVESLGKSRDGVHFLRWMLEEVCQSFAPCGALAPEGLLYREGRRSVGMKVFDLCREAGIAGDVCGFETEETSV